MIKMTGKLKNKRIHDALIIIQRSRYSVVKKQKDICCVVIKIHKYNLVGGFYHCKRYRFALQKMLF